MNDRVPDSTGLPLRAMVMVLLFLGVIFLLVGFQAMGSGSNADDDSAVSRATTSSAAPKTSTKVVAKSDVRVYNISTQAGIAGKAADQIKQGGYNVTDVGNLTLPKVTATTVYFGSAAGEQETAEAIGKLIKAPVAPRTPDVSDQPPGVIVVVTG
ncbi:LytR C-terminal domain-containing protein [Mycobacterium sp.]|uniref:LytR C-terminal domain-containing protein n=1 Tax=Mycobacterium sp. TaxID=1785 RepID=UPI0025F9E2D0|nr:LytR C-terminal domain-containing protein [Mycobacterium sp.]